MAPTQRPSDPGGPSEGSQSPVEGRSIRLNWDVFIRCVDCGEVYRVLKPSATTELIEGEGHPPGRMVLINVPNACPKCHNIREAE
jgi:hypothetical protein